MKNKVNKSWRVVFVLFVFVLVSGCGDNDKNKKESPVPAVSGSLASSNTPNVIAEQAVIPGAAVSVDGKILKKSDLENSVKDRMKMFKDKIPADKQKEFQENVKKRLVDEFIMRTLLNNEMAKRKIEVSDKEIKIAKD